MAESAQPDDQSAGRPYHHGDLKSALIAAADQILERDGPAALSLRAVAREAGVSPAAPYHHFKDKDELINAVARRGFEMLAECMASAADSRDSDHERGLAMGVAYVCFARDHPALYHIMYSAERKRELRSGNLVRSQTSAYGLARGMRERAAQKEGGAADIDVELATIAGWCAAHGLAEMCHNREFDELKKKLGGDEAFYAAVLDHLGMFRGK